LDDLRLRIAEAVNVRYFDAVPTISDRLDCGYEQEPRETWFRVTDPESFLVEASRPYESNLISRVSVNPVAQPL
jgi:hypothetical protein